MRWAKEGVYPEQRDRGKNGGKKAFRWAKTGVERQKWGIRGRSVGEKKKNNLRDTDNIVAPSPGNSDGFVGPRSADAALPLTLRGKSKVGVPPEMDTFKLGCRLFATGPIVWVIGLTD